MTFLSKIKTHAFISVADASNSPSVATDVSAVARNQKKILILNVYLLLQMVYLLQLMVYQIQQIYNLLLENKNGYYFFKEFEKVFFLIYKIKKSANLD